MTHIEKISLNGKQLQIKINNDADLSVFREVFLDRGYQMLADIIKNSTAPVLDIGSHIGLFALYANALNPTVSIYAFEPDEDNFRALKDHLKLNHVQNVYPKNVAVAGDSGQRELIISKDSHNHSLLAIENSIKTRKISAISLSDIFASNRAKFGIESYSVIKIDCEGAEFEILQSLNSEQLRLANAYYVEYHEFTPALHSGDLVKIFQGAGFKTTIEKSRYDARMGFIFARK